MSVPTDEEIEQDLSESVKRSKAKFQFLHAIYELLPKALITCEWGEGDPSIVIQCKEVAHAQRLYESLCASRNHQRQL
jgi:hypothetical protein